MQEIRGQEIPKSDSDTGHVFDHEFEDIVCID